MPFWAPLSVKLLRARDEPRPEGHTQHCAGAPDLRHLDVCGDGPVFWGNPPGGQGGQHHGLREQSVQLPTGENDHHGGPQSGQAEDRALHPLVAWLGREGHNGLGGEADALLGVPVLQHLHPQLPVVTVAAYQ